ncbi:HAD family hydrolase [candidate division WOR-3 bacterium]|nr:HAD family hydrolase [candidate division WOR-3 bacterium]
MNRAIFIDRDGTLTKEKGYVTDPSHIELIPGACEAIDGFRSLGFLTVLLTNQSAIGRGYITEEALRDQHKRLKLLLSKSFLDGIYACPHHPDDGCECRKPKPGLLRRACLDLNIDKRKSYIIGDLETDIELGKREGAKTILVLTGHGRESLKKISPDYIADDILSAFTYILNSQLM